MRCVEALNPRPSLLLRFPAACNRSSKRCWRSLPEVGLAELRAPPHRPVGQHQSDLLLPFRPHPPVQPHQRRVLRRCSSSQSQACLARLDARAALPWVDEERIRACARCVPGEHAFSPWKGRRECAPRETKSIRERSSWDGTGVEAIAAARRGGRPRRSEASGAAGISRSRPQYGPRGSELRPARPGAAGPHGRDRAPRSAAHRREVRSQEAPTRARLNSPSPAGTVW